MRVRSWLLLLVFLLLNATSVRHAAQEIPAPEAALDRAYLTAVIDAAVPEASEISTDLAAISHNNPALVWNKDGSQVLVVTWKSTSAFNRFYEKQKKTARSEDNVTWVTVVPEVRKFCQEFFKYSNDEKALSLRLKQYLGLNRNWSYDVFLEMWVRPQDLFRPCPDPEITDSTCNLEMPAVMPSVRHIKNYGAFLRNLYFRSFRTASPAPWTGLGYTYDWGNPESVRGASEFVVVPRARYKIRQVFTTMNYCSIENDSAASRDDRSRR